MLMPAVYDTASYTIHNYTTNAKHCYNTTMLMQAVYDATSLIICNYATNAEHCYNTTMLTQAVYDTASFTLNNNNNLTAITERPPSTTTIRCYDASMTKPKYADNL